MPIVGRVNKLKVLRETDIGYMLNERENEIFLHKNESNFLDLKEGDIVDAFLYYDNEGRLAATLKTPTLEEGEKAFLEVVTVLKNLGVFLSMGINKDLLLSKDDLPEDFSQWPKLGDKVYVSLHEKGRRLVARPVEPGAIYEAVDIELGINKDFRVIKIGEQGINLYNEDKELIFVHNSLIREKHRLGELLDVKVLNVSDKGFTGSLIEQKEVLRFTDADTILEALKNNGGKLPITAKSKANEVEKYFNMSRKAFKRALGLLYREDKVEFSEDETILKNGDKK